jgi:hypothetical protein
MYLDIREPGTGKLLCRYDPQRRLLEHRRRGVVTVTDLTAHDPPPPRPPGVTPPPAPAAPAEPAPR